MRQHPSQSLIDNLKLVDRIKISPTEGQDTPHLLVNTPYVNMKNGQVEKGLLGRKSGKGFYLYPKGKKGNKGGKELNPEAVSLIKAHQAAGGAGASLANDVIQDRMMCR